MGSIDTSTTTGRVEMWNGTTDGERAFLDPQTGKTNLNPKAVHNVTIHDIRTQSPQPHLNDNGYEVDIFPTKLTEEQLLNNTTPEGKQFIRDNYWPELVELIEAKTGAAPGNVVPWHFSVRKQTLGYHPDEVFFMKTGVSQPASTVHIDNSHQTAEDHLRRELGPDEAERRLAAHKRWAIVNVWRPINEGGVKRWPLMLVDHSGVEGGFNFEKHTGAVWRSNNPEYYKSHDNFIKYDPGYVFRYVSNMMPDEVLLFRDYDSRRDKVRGTPHGGFQDDATADDAPARRSIEVRLFVFWDEE